LAHSIDEVLLSRYDRPGPRYTSYPTAVQFHAGMDAASYEQAARRSGAVQQPMSLYIHVPFCESPCFYCGCTKVITRDHTSARRYLTHLFAETERQGALFAPQRPVDQLHFGGGTPTFLSDREILEVLKHLARHFSIHARPEREYSIEIDPRTVSVDRLRTLVELGFNRISLGVQDFDPAVQRAVNRVQDEEHVLSLIGGARDLSIDSISIDLIYGLPNQTIGSYSRTLDTVIAARPDRISAYSYAHLPQLFKPQKQIKECDLPTAAAKLELLVLIIEKLTAAGYVYVGMDHFALPDDELVRAQRAGTLQRNFQGYSTYADCDLVALGVSGISKVGDVYAQNARTLKEYYRLIDLGTLAIQRGIALNEDDRIRRQVIQRLMCSARIDFAQFDADYKIDFENYFSRELIALEPLVIDGLVVRNGRSIEMTARGRLLMRNVAMVFDAYLPANSDAAVRTPFSRAV